jgi:predicted lipoprotein with Yx(FWY)xxD motif
MFLRRSFYITMGLLLALFVAACGSSTTTGSSSSASPTTSSSAAAVVKTAMVNVKGKSETVLTNASGMTLYYFTPDSATTSACTGSCASTWPPLLMSGSGVPTSATALSGKLTAVTDANGNQVEYNGHPLYTYSGDTAPGQANGEGLFGKWFVATPDLAVQGGAQPAATPTSGYGYSR